VVQKVHGLENISKGESQPMATALLYIIFALTTIATFLRTWIGVAAYYTISLWYPQAQWPWVFAGVRPAFFVGGVTILCFFKDLAQQKLDFSILWQKQNAYLIVIWLALLISYIFGPYIDVATKDPMQNSLYLLSYFGTVFLFYFVAILLIDDLKKFHALIIVFMVTVLYYTSWANMQYLTVGFGTNPRLPGPGAIYELGPYVDENDFAMLFVVGVPFLYYLGRYYRNIIIRYVLWGAIPFAWHAVFLLGSLGGLIGLGVTMLFLAFRSRSWTLRIIIPILLLAAFMWQGGSYLKGKAFTGGGDVTQVRTAQTRFESWEAGLSMLKDHPLTGVGVGGYIRAYIDYSDSEPRVAHNTFLQFAAESGIMAGLMYLMLFFNILWIYWKHRGLDLAKMPPLVSAAREAILAALIGFFVCSLFLNLAMYEVFYYLLLLVAVMEKLRSRTSAGTTLKGHEA
jgi:putative inorganic carbon (hco3(-)) transporter